MTTEQTLAEARRRGIVLAVNGSKIRYDAPAGALTDELRGALRANREGIRHELIVDQGAAWLRERLSPGEMNARDASSGFPFDTWRLLLAKDRLGILVRIGDGLPMHAPGAKSIDSRERWSLPVRSSAPTTRERWEARRDNLLAAGMPPAEAARLAYEKTAGPELDAEDDAHWQRQLAERPALSCHYTDALQRHRADHRATV